MSAPLRKGIRRASGRDSTLAHAEGEAVPESAVLGCSPTAPTSATTAATTTTTADAFISPTSQASPTSSSAPKSSAKGTANDGGAGGDGGAGAGLRKGNLPTLGRSPNTRLRQPYGLSPLHSSAAQSPVLAQVASPFFAPQQPRAAADRASGAASPTVSPSSAVPIASTLPNNMPLAGLSNHLRLSEGLSCLDYHAGFRALAIGSTRQIHVVEVIPMVGHDVAAAARYKRTQQQQQKTAAAAADSSFPPLQCPLDGEQPQHTSPAASPAPVMGTAPFLMRNTGVFGGLIKVESVAWYPSTEEASLAFIQPARTVTIFLDALQFKADGTYLPQQWTRSQYKGKTLNSTMAAGGGSTAMAVVANLDGGLAGMTPATSTASLSDRSGMYTPVSTSLAGGASFSAASASHGGTPHEISLPTPNSGGIQSGPAPTMSSLPCVYRELKGPAAKELIELNIDITYMRVEKIVWDPHQPYTLALSSPTTHFELWQVPTEGMCVYAPQLVLRPPAHNTRSVVRDLVFSPSNPHVIIVVTESGNTGQVLLYDRRQVEAMRVFDMSGPGLSAAFHPLFSDLLAVSFRKEKTKPDTRISFLRVVSGDTAGALPGVDPPSTGPDGVLSVSASVGGAGVRRSPMLMTTAALTAATLDESTNSGGGASGSPASACPFLAEQSYLPPIDNYACVSRMRWRPPSLGRLTEPKRHHYMAFRPSAEELWAAQHFSPSSRSMENGEQQEAKDDEEEGGEDDCTNWVDLLHSQLWFATAAMTTDSDLSVWDAANGFFPVCAVKYLGARVVGSTSNEANDFIWVNELTLVSIFKSGEVICTSFLNSLMEGMLAAGEAYERSLRPRRKSSQRPHRSRSSGPRRRRTQQCESKARDDYAEQHRKTRAEEKDCLAMLPAYQRDPFADMFATYIVLPTSSIVSDLFGHSFTVRNSNATLRRQYNAMMRREFGQLLRRLAIQVSREAVLRQLWSEMRYQLPAGGASSPGIVSGLAALHDMRARRPRSPFTQTSGFHGCGGSSQASDSTPPSLRRSMLRHRLSAASSVSSFGARLGLQPYVGIGGALPNSMTTAAHGTGVSAHSPLFPPPPPPSLPPPAQGWSLDDVNDALLLQASHHHGSYAGPTGAFDDGDEGAHGQGSGCVGGGRDDGVISGGEERERSEYDADVVEAAASPLRAGSRSTAGGGRGRGATGWIARILGFARHERVHQYHVSVQESCAASIAHTAAPHPAEAVDVHANDAATTFAGDSVDEEGAGSSNVEIATHSPPAAAPPARRRQVPAPAVVASTAFAGLRGRPTSPISVTPVEHSGSSVGSPQQPGAADAGSPLQIADIGRNEEGSPSALSSRAKPSAGDFYQPRAASTGPRPSTSASSSSPLFSSPVGDVVTAYHAAAQGRVLYNAAGSNVSQSSAAVAVPPPPPTSVLGPGGLKSRRSGVIFAQVFPLLKEYVDVDGTRNTRRGPPHRSSSAPPQGSNTRRRKERQATIRMAEGWGRKPALLLSPLLQPSSDVTHSATPSTATTSPLQLPLSVLECGVPVTAADVKAVSARTPPSTSAAIHPAPAPTTQLITARTYLDRQRDVAAVVESFVLSDVVCGWSYAERPREELAFVCFALEWDMGYELALTMKALRHDRADAEAAAAEEENALAAAAAYVEETGRQQVGSDSGGVESALRRMDSTGGNGRVQQQQEQQRRPRHSRRDPHSQEKYVPCAVNAHALPTTKPRSHSEGARGRTQPTSSGSGSGNADGKGRVQPLLDWGRGVPAPSHQDVDDKVAAMMEENARICERVVRQQRRGGKDRSTTSTPAADQAKNSENVNDAAAADVDGNAGTTTVTGRGQHNGSGSADGGEARTPFTNGEVETWNTADPRAQWWRAAAHAWRSHHIAFIVTITTQQLEYAALMGDVQYCLVLYILFCVWWRLHSEVAEAAYKAVLLSFHKARRPFGYDKRSKSDAYGPPSARLRADVLEGDGGGGRVSSRGSWTGDDGDEKGEQQKQPQHYPPPSASHPAKGKEASSAGNRRGGMLRVSTMTSVDDNRHAETPGLRAPDLDYRLSAYDPADTSGSEPENGMERRGSCRRKGDHEKRNSLISSERLEQLRQLSLFFQRCPLVPMLPDTPQSRSASTTVTTTTTNPSAPSPSHGGGGEMKERGSSGGLLSAGYLRTSALNQSLPPRSHNGSSRRLNDTPATPAMADSVRDRGSTRASTVNIGVLAGSYRSSMTSPASPALRADVKNGTMTDEKQAKSTALARSDESRVALFNVEGLLGVRLYARSAADACSPADYCAPAEWKLRALQWLEAYTADLYARQLYVPLNELLLVMPEIFREPTNPVQPRAADIAYEKQMTYVYCGNCAKAELWSCTQPETVPAAVRLYERVLRRAPHSSSSEAEDEEGDSSSNDEAGAGRADNTGESPRRRKQHRRRRRRRITRLPADESDAASSSVFTPSVESPTASESESDEVGADRPFSTQERDHRESSMNTDVSLSSEHSTHDGAGSAAGLLDPTTAAATAAAPLDNGSSRASTAGESGGSVQQMQLSPPIPSQPSRPRHRTSHAHTRHNHNNRHSSLEEKQLADEPEEDDRHEDAADEGAATHGHPHHHTAVEFGRAAPTAHNATCRRCHNPIAMTCVICEEVVEGIFMWLRSCGHGGHVHHIEEWLQYSQECPRCGTPITTTWKGS
ncbi:hypothetical protein ABB37_08576 [Leptomonas pyrrhocoris]|uniref:Uncharacterized protein n=1 Tax=Leptomonas pyrrhocoris TaxID=157538 RepID=A0A0M9FSQ3_LEPPY|nr:hypothetical protein ABB37_08576 [Leptomonas pyrrhocoris]KPA75275.1 hypothetical protein ABB37_08576 [Leptomonas pyrrhocoris]|eukprot:XP_015653714.1 hypothetical protein ABB37_08576 [Leptomonas pyrrhocoris]